MAECSKGSILQYNRPSLSYYLSFRSLFCLFLSVCFTQVFLVFIDGRVKSPRQEQDRDGRWEVSTHDKIAPVLGTVTTVLYDNQKLPLFTLARVFLVIFSRFWLILVESRIVEMILL